jgi:hypothetical protein
MQELFLVHTLAHLPFSSFSERAHVVVAQPPLNNSNTIDRGHRTTLWSEKYTLFSVYAVLISHVSRPAMHETGKHGRESERERERERGREREKRERERE